MRFWKMNGAGNDFIILDGIKEQIDPESVPRLAALLCERHLSIGADGLMLVLPARDPAADYRMLFFNSDGSLGEMCGNGARCICRYGVETGLSGETQKVETTAGLVTGKRIDQRNYKIRLNDPQNVDLDRRLPVDGKEILCSYVELGNPGIPHGVLELPEKYVPAVRRLLYEEETQENGLQIESAELEGSPAEQVSMVRQTGRKRQESTGQQERAEEIRGSNCSRQRVSSQEKQAPACGKPSDRELLEELRELGRKLRYHASFPKGANINFYALTGQDRLDIITFERGVEDFTYACGTGTGSTVHVLSKKGLVGNRAVEVTNRGGLLKIDDTQEGLFLTGPTNIVAAGEVLDEECPL